MNNTAFVVVAILTLAGALAAATLKTHARSAEFRRDCRNRRILLGWARSSSGWCRFSSTSAPSQSDRVHDSPDAARCRKIAASTGVALSWPLLCSRSDLGDFETQSFPWPRKIPALTVKRIGEVLMTVTSGHCNVWGFVTPADRAPFL
jgi:hypothetical protein